MNMNINSRYIKRTRKDTIPSKWAASNTGHEETFQAEFDFIRRRHIGSPLLVSVHHVSLGRATVARVCPSAY